MIDKQEIIDRLATFGYTYADTDMYLLSYAQSKIESHIKHFCNIKTIPECLKYEVIDSVCGEVLGQKKATGQLSEEQIQKIVGGSSGTVKRIQDGDTTVEYATSSNVMDSSVLFDNLVKSLEISYDSLIAHRCLKW